LGLLALGVFRECAEPLHGRMQKVPRDHEPGCVRRAVGLDHTNHIGRFDVYDAGLSDEFEPKYTGTGASARTAASISACMKANGTAISLVCLSIS
jgi:hypothetical protein